MKVRPGISPKGVPFLEETKLEAFSQLYLFKSNIGVSIYFLLKKCFANGAAYRWILYQQQKRIPLITLF
jgi:hypothetical protein